MYAYYTQSSCIMCCSWGNKIYIWITNKTRITFYRFTGTNQKSNAFISYCDELCSCTNEGTCITVLLYFNFICLGKEPSKYILSALQACGCKWGQAYARYNKWPRCYRVGTTSDIRPTLCITHYIRQNNNSM
jgi:hypothetical protein